MGWETITKIVDTTKILTGVRGGRNPPIIVKTHPIIDPISMPPSSYIILWAFFDSLEIGIFRVVGIRCKENRYIGTARSCCARLSKDGASGMNHDRSREVGWIECAGWKCEEWWKMWYCEQKKVGMREGMERQRTTSNKQLAQFQNPKFKQDFKKWETRKEPKKEGSEDFSDDE